jgi:hypothetical protein
MRVLNVLAGQSQGLIVVIYAPLGERVAKVSRSQDKLHRSTKTINSRTSDPPLEMNTYSLVTLLNQVRTDRVPTQRSTSSNQERLSVLCVKYLSKELNAVAEDGCKGGGNM